MGDVEAIEGIVERFFAAFTSGSRESLDRLRDAFLPQAIIVRTCGELAVYDVDGFVEPRAALLTDGTLADFREWVTGGHVEVFGDVAHWFGTYAKAGIHNGVPTAGNGAKSIQFVRTAEGWRIAAAAWDDER